jgi:hypothetical protein
MLLLPVIVRGQPVRVRTLLLLLSIDRYLDVDALLVVAVRGIVGRRGAAHATVVEKRVPFGAFTCPAPLYDRAQHLCTTVPSTSVLVPKKALNWSGGSESALRRSP